MLGRASSTISREIKHNSRPTKVWTGGYAIGRSTQAVGLSLQAGTPARPTKPREQKRCDGTFAGADRCSAQTDESPCDDARQKGRDRMPLQPRGHSGRSLAYRKKETADS
ncbi:hypothetical protein IVB45_05625 [Bradyrhizobium sp. 4]|nr:hypothetical protein [Bradyrhizobium sp. 39]MCK1635975.1 hypothetical protein [Bradyrhizobium sp. 162]MCK1752230.1 hypothetical protein [Bradyrhizobium sp. 135]UPJ36416.1 hypothetical protein IVB45_05625 [Bradyrhizobium sp. 4]